MSTTIDLGYLTIDNSEIYTELKFIAEKFGYGLFNGIEYSESDVCPGLEVMQKNENWKHILFLQSPINDDVSLAFGIHQELNSLGLTGARPKFLDFLSVKSSEFFFAGEWYESDRVRYAYRNIDRLITLLSLPGHWGGRYMIPETGHLQDSDEVPFIFSLNLK